MGGGEASAPNAKLLAALGVPLGTLTTVAGRGMRAVVHRAILTQHRYPNFAAAVKIQPWDDRVDGEVAALAAVSALYAQAASMRGVAGVAVGGVGADAGAGAGAGVDAATATATATPLLPPLALFRDANDAHFIFADGGAALNAAMAADGAQLPSASIRAVATALSGAALLASLGRLHADIHPSNLLMGAGKRGMPTLIDLGSTLPLREGGQYSGPTRGGRWDYMPPEQFGPGAYAAGDVILNPSADVFAAGTLLAGALAGVAPFAPPPGTSARLTVPGTLRHAARAARRGISSALTASAEASGAAPLPSALLEWIDHATAPDQTTRFPHAADALDALVGVVENSGKFWKIQENSLL